MTRPKTIPPKEERPLYKLPIVAQANPPPFLELAKRVLKDPERLAKVLEMNAQYWYGRGLRDANRMHEEIDKLTPPDG